MESKNDALQIAECNRISVGDRFTMVLAHLPFDQQPDGVHTVARIEDGVVYWQEGGMSPLEHVAGGRWKRVIRP